MELALWKLILDLPRRRVHLLPTLQTHIPERAYHITSDSIRLDSTSPQTARQRATARLSERVKEKCAGRDSNPELQPYQTDILAIGPPHAYCNNSFPTIMFTPCAAATRHTRSSHTALVIPPYACMHTMDTQIFIHRASIHRFMISAICWVKALDDESKS